MPGFLARVSGSIGSHTVELKRLASGAEIRLLVPGGFAGTIRGVTIAERAQG
jgi:hypothetical protein